MKVLITGGGGFLGSFLNWVLNKEHRILSLYHNSTGNSNLFNSRYADIANNTILENIFREFKPDVVVHSAGISSSAETAKHPAKYVYNVNVNATENIARLCNLHKAKLIFLSTDLVYAGYRGQMLNEDAKLIPISLYAETKLMGEVKIQNTFENFIILRCALMFGLGTGGANNFFAQSYNKLINNIPIKVFTDQYRTPLSGREAAGIITSVLESDVTGIFNMGGRERLSRYELFTKLCSAAGIDEGLLLKVKMSEIHGYTAVEDVSMDTSKLQSIGVNIISVEESILKILNNKEYD
ncbi:MAG: sugar nucleotide-binding protein [Bacteroidota bacterium]|nr:sugar nucleotide-binding protein [Bacteroidota bacterium]